MNSLVTGIGGFVGCYLADYLIQKGHKVSGIERRPKAKVEGAAVFSCDVLDREKVFSIVKNSNPDLIFHLAATSSVEQSMKDEKLAEMINVEGTRNLLDSAVKHAPDAFVLVVSTAHVYGIPKSTPISESHPLNPVSAYGWTRVEQEKLAAEFFKKHKLRTVVSRSFNHTGPRQPVGFICSDFAKQIAAIEKGAKPEMKVGNLSAKRDFTDVRDVVKAYLLALQKCKPGEIYNVCSGNSYSAREILDTLLSMTKSRIKVIEDKSAKKGDIPTLAGDNSKFRKATGWKPEIPFEKTLSDVLDYWRNA